MKKVHIKIAVGVCLVLLSILAFYIQIRIFHSERDTFFYLLQDLAFVPIQVLLVTLIVDQVLKFRERAMMLNRLNMVIGTFFSEVGTPLLRAFIRFDHHVDRIQAELLVNNEWTEQRFGRVTKELQQYDYRIDARKGDLAGLKRDLNEKRFFLLSLLENQNLLEHETFTELLWAVFHLTEELIHRSDLSNLSTADRDHLSGDIRRAYIILISEWLSYMKHLKKEYPYLFSLAVRTNPFDDRASVSVA